MNNFTKPFKNLSKNDTNIAGGKGASLGEMINSGITVPDGFVVLSSTFDEFIEQTDLIQEIEAILDSVDHKIIHTVDKASDKIRELIISREIPEGIKNEIMQSFEILGANFVAVRSSATAEDGADNAWAGQLESYLNVTEKDVLEKVKECWSSLFTARAIFYRFEKDLQLTKISVAVVVQKMVNSEKSGIAFSVHPVTEDRNQLIIEAGYGLGEAIVSGSVTPDSYVVSKSPREIIDINVGSQNKALYRDLKDGGNKWIELNNEKANSQVLSEKEIFEFSEIVIGIENHYGFPCDIEWAYEGGKFYIVQSRPITTLKNREELIQTINLVKEHSREYSIVQINSYCEIINKVKDEMNCSIENELFLYNPQNKLVSIYHEPQELKNLFAAIGTLATDESFLKRILSSFEESLSNIKPYLENKKVVKDITEFEALYDLFSQFYLGIAYVWVLPLLGYLPESVKNKALKLREDTEKYSSRRDRVLIDNLKIIFPEVGDLVKYLSIDEIKKGKITKELIQQLEERGNGFIYYQNNIYQGNLYEEFFAKNPIRLDDQVIDKNIDNIRGSVGFKGFVRGVVRLIFTEKDLDSFKQGEILVSPMTRPEFLPVMKEAIAFVTDEGGITCHAAIVARELKKPCIIGTKIATQVLRDGDLVEVDADNGMVRILERANENNDGFGDKSIKIRENIDEFFEKNKPETEDLIYYSFPGYPIFHYFFSGISPSLKYNNTYLLGEFPIKYQVQENTEAYMDHRVFTIPGHVFVSLIEKEDKDFTNLLYTNYIAITNLADKLQNINKQEIQNKIIPEYSSFYDEYSKLFPWVAGVGSSIDIFLEDYVKKNKIDLSNLKIPGKSFLTKEEESLQQVVMGKKDFEDHKAEYSFILSNYKGYFPIPDSYFNNRFDEVKDKKFKPIISVKKPTNISEWIAFSIYIRDERKRCNMLFNAIYSRYIIRECDKYNLVYEDIVMLSPVEFENQKTLKEIKKYNGIRYIKTSHLGGFVSITEDEWNKQVKIIQKNEISGVVASPGIIKGKVSIILNKDDFKKVQKGDIIVASMTRPDFVPILNKASAIVTNEGGVTCHAAIISRELGIPCVIGTKFATQVLKDGDLVEVDADNGVVRILKNTNKESDITEEILSTEWYHLGKWIEPALAAEIWLEYASVAQQFFKNVLDKKILYLNGDFLLSKHDSDIFQNEAYEAAKNHNIQFFEHIYKTVKYVSLDISTKSKKINSVSGFLEEYKMLTGVWMPLNNVALGIEKYVQEINSKAFEFTKGFLDEKPMTLMQIDEMIVLKNKIEKTIGKKLEDPEEIPEEHKKEIEIHIKKYEWLGSHHFNIGKLNIVNLVQRMKEVKKEDSKKLLNNNDKELGYLVWLLDLIGYTRFKPAETSGYATYNLKDKLQNIAEKKGLDYEDIVEHTIEEISSKNISKDIAKQRRLYTGFYFNGLKYSLDKDQINTCVGGLLKTEENNTLEIKGISAQKGKVSGFVKIVNKQNQSDGFEPGMIVVSHETTPDIICVMQKSGAIVTDFGGLTSHAAIVARELKKPCIVGTKIATQVLKDGDFVEVDADNGVIKIIK